jgi:hypothetical protein
MDLLHLVNGFINGLHAPILDVLMDLIGLRVELIKTRNYEEYNK